MYCLFTIVKLYVWFSCTICYSLFKATITVLLDTDGYMDLQSVQAGLEARLVGPAISSTPQSKLIRFVCVVKKEKSRLVFSRSQSFSISDHVRELEEPVSRKDIHSKIGELMTKSLWCG